MIAIIGGAPRRFAPLVDLYRERPGQETRARQRVGINSHIYIAETSKQARDEFYPAYAPMMNRIGRERGWPPLTRHAVRRRLLARRSPAGRHPQEVTEKILAEHELFDHDRFLAHISVGTLPHEQAMRATELYATEVAPAVRAALSHSRILDTTARGGARTPQRPAPAPRSLRTAPVCESCAGRA